MGLLGIRSPLALRLVAVGALSMAAVSIGAVVARAAMDHAWTSPRWGIDFAQWWNGGRLLLAGKNPYAIRVPSAAPILLVLAPFALLPWVPATLLWTVLNLLLAAVCVWLMCWLAGIPPWSLAGAALLGLFCALIATRQVLELGQISILITACMLGTLVLLDDHPWWAGVLLGIAISKYTMAFPLVAACLLWKRGKPLLAVVAVQVGALAAVTALTNTSPLAIVADYLRYSREIMAQTQDYSVHLLSLHWGVLGPVAVAAFSLLLAAGLAAWYRRARTQPGLLCNPWTRLTLVGVGSIWSLYVLYHGRQDMVLAFLFITAADARGTGRPPGYYALSDRQRSTLNGVLWLVLLIWILPWYVVTGTPVYRSVYTLTTVAVGFVWLWLLWHIPVVTQGQSVPCDQTS